jgi:hypothetical protein
MARTRHAAVGSGADAPDRGPRLRLRAKTEDPPPVAGSGRSHTSARVGKAGARRSEAREMRARLRFENVLRHLSHIQTAETGSLIYKGPSPAFCRF